MAEYVISYAGEGIGRSLWRVAAGSEEHALRKFVEQHMLTDELFRSYIYEFSIDGFSGRFFSLVSAGVHHGIRTIRKVREQIDAYFAPHSDFADYFFEFFMVWFPVETSDDSEQGRKLLAEIETTMANYRFPREMEIFIAMKEAAHWCHAEVSLDR